MLKIIDDLIKNDDIGERIALCIKEDKPLTLYPDELKVIFTSYVARLANDTILDEVLFGGFYDKNK